MNCYRIAKINQKLQEIIDRQTDPWGIKVVTVEVKDVVCQMDESALWRSKRDRTERRAKIINAEGEFQAAEAISDSRNDERTAYRNTVAVFANNAGSPSEPRTTYFLSR